MLIYQANMKHDDYTIAINILYIKLLYNYVHIL